MSWAKMSERGTIVGLVLLAAAYRLLGRTICSLLGAPVVLYFVMTGTVQRKASKEFLTRVFGRKPTFLDVFRHFMSFYQMMLDKFTVWSGRVHLENIECDDPEYVRNLMYGRKGGVLLVSHLGCMEFCQGLMSKAQRSRMHILMHTGNAQKFNRVLAYFKPNCAVNILEVSDVGPDTFMFLKDRIENGDWVVIAADRTPISEVGRVTSVQFLGAEASFSQGPYIMASLLHCPVYTGMAVRKGSKYKVSMELFAEQIVLQRGRKDACINKYAVQYAAFLERYCHLYPYQWYNFFPFWG